MRERQCGGMKCANGSVAERLKPNTCADHTTYTGATRPATTDLALDEDVAVFIAESHATSAVVALVVGIERTGEAGWGRGFGKLEGLHQRLVMILMEKIDLYYFGTALPPPLKKTSPLRVETGGKPSPPPTVQA